LPGAASTAVRQDITNLQVENLLLQELQLSLLLEEDLPRLQRQGIEALFCSFESEIAILSRVREVLEQKRAVLTQREHLLLLQERGLGRAEIASLLRLPGAVRVVRVLESIVALFGSKILRLRKVLQVFRLHVMLLQTAAVAEFEGLGLNFRQLDQVDVLDQLSAGLSILHEDFVEDRRLVAVEQEEKKTSFLLSEGEPLREKAVIDKLGQQAPD